jgi:hypothetical protein
MEGTVKSFLLKGRVGEVPPEREIDATYFDPEKIEPMKRPIELIPFYDVSKQHFNSADAPVNDQQAAIDFRITAFALHPHMSFTGFQH